ncbi:nucleotide exchange factor GrpE, partial [Acidobacteriota bacterium]
SSTGDDVPESYSKGVELIYLDLLSAAKKQGLSIIEAEGQQFDPNVHEAMMRENTTEYKDNEVIEELQKGYMLHDRLLRPAMVKVAFNETEGEEKKEFFADEAEQAESAPDSSAGQPGKEQAAQQAETGEKGAQNSGGESSEKAPVKAKAQPEPALKGTQEDTAGEQTPEGLTEKSGAGEVDSGEDNPVSQGHGKQEPVHRDEGVSDQDDSPDPLEDTVKEFPDRNL